MKSEQIHSQVGRKFQPGFRLSTYDAFVLGAGVVGTIFLSSFLGWTSLLVAYVVGHFFLFCNVLRVARVLELVWAGIFVALAAGTIVAAIPGWPITIAVSLGVTFVVAAVTLRKPSYHGVGWKRINPNLLQWWAANVARDHHRSGDNKE